MNSKLPSIEYLFTSERLGFRNWKATDKELYVEMNADPAVMRFFPSLLSPEASHAGVDRFSNHFEKHGFTYFAVDDLANLEFIGFIGMYRQDYKSPFTPFIDIGWRLRPKFWGLGLATEGARACLKFAFEELNIPKIYATVTWNNEPSMNVMKKIGMEKIGEFVHPNFAKDHVLQPVFVYCIEPIAHQQHPQSEHHQ